MKYYLTQEGKEFIKEEDGAAVQGVKEFEKRMAGVGAGETPRAKKAIEASREVQAAAEKKAKAAAEKKAKK